MDEAELAKAMTSKGMLSIDEILSGNLMGKFSTNVGVVDINSLLKWVEQQNEKFLRMRMEYELGIKQKDELYEWVFAHSAVFATVQDHMRKALNPPTDKR